MKKSFPMPKPASTVAVEPVVSKKALDAFITTGEVRKPKKKQISLVMTTDLIDQIDAAAEDFGMSRAAFMNAALSIAVKEGLKIRG